MKRQPGLEVAEKLSIMQKTLDSKTRKMKEFAGEINMYQAKVKSFIFSQTNSNTTSKELRNRSKKSSVNTMSRRRENRLVSRIKRYYSKADDYIIITTYFIII